MINSDASDVAAEGLNKSNLPLSDLTFVNKGTEPTSPSHHVVGKWFAVIRLGAFGVIGLTIALYLIALPYYFQFLQTLCPISPCPDERLTTQQFDQLQAAGIPLPTVAALWIVFNILFAALFTCIALLILYRKSNDGMALFVAVMLVTFGVGTYSDILLEIAKNFPLLVPLVQLVRYIGNTLVLLFLFLFPNGRFIPRWMLPVAGIWVIAGVPRFFFPYSALNPTNWPPPLQVLLFVGTIGCGLLSQVYRYRNLSTPLERDQTKWVVYGSVIGLGLFLLVAMGLVFFSELDQSLLASVFGSLVLMLCIAILPVSIGIAILRSHLWDIDLLINRTLMYGALTAILAGLFAASITVTQKIFVAVTGQQSDVATVLTTLVVVAAFDPVKKRVESFVDSHFKYPTRSFGVFGEQIKAYVQLNDPRELAKRFHNESLVTFGAQSGAIYLGQGAQLQLVQSLGEWDGHAHLVVPLDHTGKHFGLIALGARRNGDDYTARDHASMEEMSSLVARAIDLAQGTVPARL